MTTLSARRIMILEDSFLLAMEVKTALEGAGAGVVGPFATADRALRSLEGDIPDCALLDVNLGEGASYDLARALRMRGIPFVFFTGYDRAALLPEFDDVDRLEKPVDVARLVDAMDRCCRASSPT